MYLFYLDGVQLPVAPPKLQVKIKNQNKTANLINEGEINIIKSPGLTELSFSALIPRQKYPFAKYPEGFKSPAYFLEYIEALKVKGKVFKFNVIRMAPSGVSFKQDTSMDVTLEDYTLTEQRSDGTDFTVDFKLKQYKTYGTKTIEIKKKEAAVSTDRDSSNKVTYKTHKVVKGDTLWALAKKYLGNATKHPQIYNLNKDLIEKTAKKYGRKSSSNGHWIYPGTVLNIPN